MNKILPVFSKIRIHPLTWAVMGLGAITAQFMELLMMFFIVLIHELGHAAAAQICGWRIKVVTLLPFGGELETEEHGNRPWKEEMAVLLAGPLQHLWLYALAFLLYVNGWMGDHLYQEFLLFNTVIMAVNFLPVWPLDGGKLLFIFLSLRYPFVQAHRLIIQYSIGILAVLLVCLLLLNPLNFNWWVIAGFLGYSLWKEWKHRQYVFMRFLLERHYGHQQDIRAISKLEAARETPIFEILEHFRRDNKHVIVIKKDMKEIGKLDESEVLHACFTSKLAYRPIGELLYPY